MAQKIKLSHPGEILYNEFLEPLGLSQYRLAKEIGVTTHRINEIVHGNRAITPDTSMRLAKFFGLSDSFFLNLQMDYDIRMLKRTKSAASFGKIKPMPRPDIQQIWLQ